MKRSGFTHKRRKPLKRAPIVKVAPPPDGKRRPIREPLDLEAARYTLVERSGGFCEVDTPGCPPGRHRGHHAHHALMRSQTEGHDAEGMLWVCWEGHGWIHAHPKESYARGWLIHPDRTIAEPGVGGSYFKPGMLDADD